MELQNYNYLTLNFQELIGLLISERIMCKKHYNGGMVKLAKLAKGIAALFFVVVGKNKI